MKIIKGNSLEVLKTFEENSVDSIVTDPPYFLINNNGSGFMNKGWDGIIGLWKYQWNDKAFVDFVISLLKSCRVENDMVEVNTVQENANTQAGEKITENNANSAKGNLNTQTKDKGSAQVIILTKQGLLDLLKGELSVLTKLNQFLIGEKENAVYVIPIISLQSERKTIVQKSVTTLHKAIGFQETKITFTKTELQKKRDAIEAIIGESSENLFTKGMGGNVDIVQSIVVKEKSNATTSHHIDSQQTMANLTLLLCAYFATRKSSEIQKDLIKTFFRVIFLEVNRVLKPGGHVLAFAGSRTYQWLATGIEDAGFEIRDQIMYVYGSGFPKSHNIGKSVDKLQGNDREVTGTHNTLSPGDVWRINGEFGGESVDQSQRNITKGSSPYEGWGTALKPAHEPIVVARKPLSEKTIAKNVLEWGTGGINIDGCRVESTEDMSNLKAFGSIDKMKSQGRFPANFIHDGSDEVVGLFPETKSGGGKKGNVKNGTGMFGSGKAFDSVDVKPDSSSAARFFKTCAFTQKHDTTSTCKNIFVDNVIKLLGIIQVTIVSFAPLSVEDSQEEQKDLIARYVEKNADVCEIYTALVLAKIKSLDSNQEALQAIQDSITNSKECTQILNHVLLVENKENTDITQITTNLLKLFGYVQSATDENTNLDTKEAVEQRSEHASFAYFPKASKKDRNEGLEGFEEKRSGSMEGNVNDGDFLTGSGNPRKGTNKNFHPTVKPTALMQYLVRLVTPVGGTVLDPFMGSGSTGKACMKEGFDFIGIEQDAEYCKIAEARIKNEKEKIK